MTTKPTYAPIDSTTVPGTGRTEGSRCGERYRHLLRAVLGDNYRVGVAIEELEPGRRSTPLHFHLFEEEHVYLPEGSLTAQIGAERFAMRPGGYACFPAGLTVPHALRNDSGRPCSYLMIGERLAHDVRVYPDPNKVCVNALGRGRPVLDLAAVRGYRDGEGG